MLATFDIIAGKKTMNKQIFVEAQMSEINNYKETLFGDSPEDVLQGMFDQLGPSIVDEEASSYASTLLQVPDPTTNNKNKSLQRTNGNGFDKEGYFTSTDADTVYDASEQLGPSIVDEEVSGYISHILA